METVTEIPWDLVLPMSAWLLIFAESLLLIVFKAQPARYLGRLLFSYLLLLLPFIKPDLFRAGTLIIPVLISLYLYIEVFFSTNSRRKPVHTILILAVPLLLLTPSILQLIVSLVVTGFYLYLIVRKIGQVSRIRGIDWWTNVGPRLNWFRVFVILNILYILWIMSGVGISMMTISGFAFLLVLTATYQMVKESDFFSELPTSTKYQKSTLSAEIRSGIYKKVYHAFSVDKYYLNDNASLSELAKRLGTTTHNLSQVINETMKTSFQELLAKSRIRDACSFLRKPENEQIKIEQIAAMVGYNSKSAFNTAFKKYTGLTPPEYKTARDVQPYRDEHLPGGSEPSLAANEVALSHVFNRKIIMDMIQNFFKVFLRYHRRNIIFSSINLGGLTVGLTSAIFIFLFIQDELSYDKSIADSDRIYRIAWINSNPQTRTPHPLSYSMKQEWPEVEQAVSLSPWYGPGLSKELIRVQNPRTQVVFEEPNFYFADSTFFDVFSIEIVEGDPDALSKPFAFVITEQLAHKYFGKDSSAIGRLLEVYDMPMEVTTVVKSLDKNSHFHFSAIIPYATLKEINPTDSWMTWADFGHFNYIKVRPGTDMEALRSRMPEWIVGFVDWPKKDVEGLLAGEDYFEFQPIEKIHLHSNLRWELENNGNILYIYILSAVLVFILLIVSINYINLATAKSVERAKEIGVRKTFGAIKSHLNVQFYLESIAFTTLATIFSLFFVLVFMDSFNELTGKSFSTTSLWSFEIIVFLIACAIGIGIIAGFYPAMVLSGFRPSEVLKGKLSASFKGMSLRKTLVIIQFMVSAILITGSLIIMQQINYMQDKDLGFDKEAVLSFKIPVSVERGGIDLVKLNRIKNELQQVDGIKDVSMISNLPGDQFNQHRVYLKGQKENIITSSEVMVDYNFEKVLGLQVKKGRSFDQSFPSDTARTTFMINESMAKSLGIENPVGEKIVWIGNDKEVEGTVIGVINDFHYKSLHSSIQPLLIAIEPADAGHLLIRVDGNKLGGILPSVEIRYNQLTTGIPFEYHFLDEQLASLYDQEKKTLQVFAFFSGIALVLACLGLLGMAIATINQRIKEVGIRKVLGASSSEIIMMVLGQFLQLIIIALLIGLPLSYVLMSNWLAEFSYQVPFSFSPYILSIIILLTVSFISVITSVLKVSVTNPVKALRYE